MTNAENNVFSVGASERSSTTPREAHLWAVGYDDPTRAERAREEVSRLAGAGHYLIVLDVAILERHADGTYVLDREPFPVTGNIFGAGTLGFLAGLALAAPMTGAAVGALLGTAASTVAGALRIEKQFIREVEAMMRPGTSALLLLDDQGDMDVILHAIRGLGGIVLKTNVDVERARLIQSTLLAKAARDGQTPDPANGSRHS
jgi:uncharacterized membrane protein